MTQKSISSRAWAEMVLLATIWGASFVSIRIALDEIGPLTSVAWMARAADLGDLDDPGR